MSAAVGAAAFGDDPQPALWSPGPRPDFGCHHDLGDPGRFDESARRLMHEELMVASLLVAEGHVVVALRENPRQGRTPDLAVCGQTAEVKSVSPPEPEFGAFPSAKTVRNQLVNAMGQSHTVFIDATRSGLSPSVVGRGVQLFAQRPRQGGIRAVRILGDGYDLSFRAQPSRIRVAEQRTADQRTADQRRAEQRRAEQRAQQRRSGVDPPDLGLGL